MRVERTHAIISVSFKTLTTELFNLKKKCNFLRLTAIMRHCGLRPNHVNALDELTSIEPGSFPPELQGRNFALT